jgi:protein CLEC16A
MLRNLLDSFKPKQKNLFTIEHLQCVDYSYSINKSHRFLYGQLVRNPIINDQNKSIIIESLRQIAELMIWGDQHNSEFFEYVPSLVTQ